MAEIGEIHGRTIQWFLDNHPTLKPSTEPPRFRKKRWVPVLMREVVEVESIVTRDNKPIKFMVLYDALSEEMISWVLRKDLSANLVVIDRDYARIRAVEEAWHYLDAKDDQKQDITAPFAGPSVELLEPVSGERVFSVSWRHLVDDILVEDDFLAVEVDPKDGEVISLTNHWHKITKQSMPLSDDSAYEKAIVVLKERGFDPPPKSFAFEGKRYVSRPGKPNESPEFKLTWYFRISDNHHSPSGHFWDVYIDASGEVFKLTSSR